MASTSDYTGLISSAWQNKPKFTAMVTVDVSVQVQVQNIFLQMIALLGTFDIDSAVGAQLDILGLWIGFSREIEIPITNIYFSWDGSDPTLGWDSGVWQPDTEQYAIYLLPDDVYRFFLKAKIIANQWNGLTTTLYDFFDIAFPDITILVQDPQDMSFGLIFVGQVDALTIALITEGYFPIKPEGVRLKAWFPPVPVLPAFGWDIETFFMQGWDEGAWYKEIDTA